MVPRERRKLKVRNIVRSKDWIEKGMKGKTNSEFDGKDVEAGITRRRIVAAIAEERKFKFDLSTTYHRLQRGLEDSLGDCWFDPFIVWGHQSPSESLGVSPRTIDPGTSSSNSNGGKEDFVDGSEEEEEGEEEDDEEEDANEEEKMVMDFLEPRLWESALEDMITEYNKVEWRIT